MDDLGRRDQGSARRRFGRLGIIGGVLAVGLAIGVAPVIGDGTNKVATPNVVENVPTVPATEAQVAASSMSMNGAAVSAKKKSKKKQGIKNVLIESRITDSAVPIVTQQGTGTYVQIECPRGSVAVSGGMVTSSINLLMSASAPNNPITGVYTPRKWWVTVTNVNVDGQGGPLSWRGVVNCLSPAKIKR
ncbi:MAG TPA: hypothetical protein VMF31_09070 [Solirubrobacterales bacterium]|nr:hypothetical protein [Solirubrobacterales bacterium]